MYLSKLRVTSFKSFHDSGELFFKPGINIIIGPNNSGKTALLEALSLKISNNPHKSEKTIPSRNSPFGLHSSKVEFTVTIESDELKHPNNFQFDYMTVPAPADGRIDDALAALNRARKIGLHIKGGATSKGINHELDYGLYESARPGFNNSFMKISLDGDGRYKVSMQNGGADLKESTAWKIIEPFADGIYRFEAERMKLSSYPLDSSSTELLPNAENLAEVLHILQTQNPARFKRLINYVTSVIPSVKWITVVPVITKGPATVSNIKREIHIKIWPVEQDTERDDLAIDLSEAGTGIGQVLAMLYVIFTSDEPRIIIIDEPQSFLHPGAIRKLIEILQLFPQHQYFISTHSPDILSTAKPSTITSLQYEDGVSSAKAISLEQTAELRDVLNQIGVKFGDVFFATSILWVEGPTETLAFPLILGSSEQFVSGISILPLINTGDLRSKKHVRKHARLVFDIYSKLSGAHALAPPVVGVILDREDTNTQEMKELKRISNGLLTFLPRRLYENYLLDPDALSAVANEQDNFSDSPVTSLQIEEWINKKRSTGAYLPDKLMAKEEGLSDSQWLINVDGAKLLEDLFRHFSGVVSYIKTRHSIEITSWLLNNKPKHLLELKQFLESILPH